MDKNKIIEIIEYINNIENIDIDKFPDIDLYMDQVTTFIEDKLKDYKRDDNQKILTKTMINNYTKDKLLPVSIKKKYNKNHLIFLILIYHLKSILSISDISCILNNQSENIEQIYLSFKNIQDKEFSNHMKSLLDRIYSENLDEDIKLISFLISIINEANQRKLLVEKIIDVYFKN